MGKNKEEFMKDRARVLEGSISTNLQMIEFYQNNIAELIGEVEEQKHLLSQSKTLISDMVMYNLDKDMYNRYDDVMKQSQELLTELKEY